MYDVSWCDKQSYRAEIKGTVPYPINPFGTSSQEGGGGGGGRDEVCIVYSRASYKYELSAVHIVPE